MVIPWELVASVVVAVAVGAVVAHRRGGAVGPVADLVAAVGLPALVAARAAVLVRAALLTGTIPPPTAWLTVTAGMSFPVALLVALAVGARRLRRAEDPAVATTAVVATWAGVVAWAASAVVRDEVVGISAPVPLGLPWPGHPSTAVPVGLLEAVVLAALLAVARRRHRRDPAGLGAWLVASLAAVDLVGDALRPSLATVDRDLDVLMGLVALIAAVAATRRPSRTALTRGGAVAGVVALTLVVGTLTGAAPATVPSGAVDPSLEGALVADGGPADPPVWGADELEGHLAGSDRPVVVNLWASWCPPCHAEAPALARAARALGDRATVLGVLVDDRPETAQAFVDRYDLPFPTVVDGGAAAALGQVGLPTTVVLDASGQVVDRIVGGVDAGSLASAIARAG